jgi:hypothetical protein
VGKDISLNNENKIITQKNKLKIILMFFDSTISVPTQGIALIRLVIQI